MTFIEFLLQKRINTATFQVEKPEMWQHFSELFAQMGEKSFDAQKKFYFNPLRLDFPLSIEAIEKIEADKRAAIAAKKTLSKPIIPVAKSPENVPDEPVKKMPPKMKPVMKKEAVSEEKTYNELEPAKKVPPKMKPIMKKEAISEGKEVLISAENEIESAKKVPPKMKPFMKKD